MSCFWSAGGSGRSQREATLSHGQTCKLHAETLRAQGIEARPSSCEATALTILLNCSREKTTSTALRLLLLLLLTIRQLPNAAALVPSQLSGYSETMSSLRDRISHGLLTSDGLLLLFFLQLDRSLVSGTSFLNKCPSNPWEPYKYGCLCVYIRNKCNYPKKGTHHQLDDAGVVCSESCWRDTTTSPAD